MNAEPPVISKRRIWLKRLFRWFRMVCLLGLLGCILGGIYLNKVGLPDFIKNPLLEELRSKGLNLSIRDLRLHVFRGVVGEKITLIDSDQSDGAKLTIEKADIRLNRSALWRMRIKVESMLIHQACLSCPPPLPADNQELMTIDNVSAELRFLNDNLWQLARFKAHTLGLDFDLSATITNGPSIFKTGKPQQSGTKKKNVPWTQQWQLITQIMNQWTFQVPPSIKVHLWADAKNWSRMQAEMTLNVPEAKTPWGHLNQCSLNCRIEPEREENKIYHSEIKANVKKLVVLNTSISEVRLDSRMIHSLTNTTPESIALSIKINDGTAPWGKWGYTQATAELTNHISQTNVTYQLLATTELARLKLGNLNKVQLNTSGLWTRNIFAKSTEQKTPISTEHKLLPWVPDQWVMDFRCQNFSNQWAFLQELSCSTKGTPSRQEAWPDNVAFWRYVTPFNMSYQIGAKKIQTTNVNLNALNLTGNWQPPELIISNANVAMNSGELILKSQLDIISRKMSANVTSAFDVKQCAPLLDTNAQKWLEQFGWGTIPPKIVMEGRMELPSWTNRHPDWRGEVLPKVLLTGFIQGTNCSYRSVPIDRVSLHLNLSNATWDIPDLKVLRPEGYVTMAHTASIFSKDYSWKGISTIDPKALKPILTAPQQKALDFFQFTSPPHLNLSLWGTYQDLDRLGLNLKANITNFTFKSEQLSSLEANITFSNQLIRATEVHISRGTQHVYAPLVTFETDSQTLTISNTLAKMDVGVITRPIGPKTAKSVSPYRFDNPPEVMVNGYIVVPGPKAADMTFKVKGGPFHFSRFNMPSVSALIHWKDDSMVITNFTGQFYEGEIVGWLGADFRPENHTDLNFQLEVTNVNAKPFIQDISLKPKRLEGILSGGLVITYANSTNFNSWQGYGAAKLQRGLIWDIPLFGIMSPVLNTLAPGIGNSKAEEAAGRFTITNSVIRTRDTQIQAQSLRIYYDGTVDFDGRVDATVQASFFRNTWLVGRLLSFALSPVAKILEYKVTGTLSEPKLDPLYIPSFIMAPLRPVRTFKEIFQKNDKEKKE